MYCENCGSKKNPEDVYCENCGTKFADGTVGEVIRKRSKTPLIICVIALCIFLGIGILAGAGSVIYRMAFDHDSVSYQDELEPQIATIRAWYYGTQENIEQGVYEEAWDYVPY